MTITTTTITPTADYTPPQVPPILYTAHLGTRWQKEKAAAGLGAFDFPEDPVYVGQWILGECVGKGASGRVRIAKNRQTGQLAAVKILPLDAHPGPKSEKQRLNIDREIVVMKLMDHPNILRIYDVFQGEHELYLVLEYVQGGELFDFLVNRGRLPLLEALAIFKQIVYGLNYAHALSVVHRDLKPENILIHSLNPPLIKIADWGMAAFAPPPFHLETSCGSPHYASPEIISGRKYAGGATDIWSCGVILFALLTGRLPFDDKDPHALLAKVRKGKYEVPDYVDPVARDLLTRMLVVDVRRRITIPQIMAHPWFNGSTPGILYVPAPSVHTLAQLLASEVHIDEDLLESLRVLLGRHGNNQIVKAELLRPPGQGILAKAIYVLLQKRHEQMVRDHGLVLSVEGSKPPLEKVVTKHYWSPSLTKQNRLDVQAQNSELYQLSRDTHSSRSQTPSSSPPSETPSVLESPSRCGSPSSVRLHRSCDFSSSTLAEQPHCKSLRVGHAPDDSSDVLTRVSRQTCSVSLHSNHVKQECVDHNRKTLQTACDPEMSPPWSNVRHPLTRSVQPVSTPSVADAHTAMLTGFEVHDKTPIPSYRFGAPYKRPPSVCLDGPTQGDGTCAIYSEEEPRVSINSPLQLRTHTRHGHAWKANDWSTRENKENIMYDGGTDRSQLPAEVFAQSTGGTVIHKHDRDSKCGAKKVKNPTTGSSPITFRPAKTAFGPHTSSPVTPSNLSSPVGEVKSWLSNLFNRKPCTYVLYSIASLHATRNEAIRTLERLGVTVDPQESSSPRQGCGVTSIVRCQMNDGVKYSDGTVVQKHIRFRVEFSFSPNALRTSDELSSPCNPDVPPRPRCLATGAAAWDFPCAVVLVHEKGWVSVFKAMCQRLRELWTLDTLGPSLQAGSARL